MPPCPNSLTLSCIFLSVSSLPLTMSFLLPLAHPISFSHVILALSLLRLSSSASLPLAASLAPTEATVALGGHSLRCWRVYERNYQCWSRRQSMCFYYLFIFLSSLMLLVIYSELEPFSGKGGFNLHPFFLFFFLFLLFLYYL